MLGFQTYYIDFSNILDIYFYPLKSKWGTTLKLNWLFERIKKITMLCYKNIYTMHMINILKIYFRFLNISF